MANSYPQMYTDTISAQHGDSAQALKSNSIRLNPGSTTPCHLEQVNDISGLSLFTQKVPIRVPIAEACCEVKWAKVHRTHNSASI